MRQLVLDTNILIRHWNKSKGATLGDKSVADAEKWARRLVELQDTDAIVTPVAIEFLCGVKSGHELELSRAFLGIFTRIDRGEITEEDWTMARGLAERIPQDSSPRDLGDCLIKAIAVRLRHEVFTLDKGMPRTASRKSKQPGSGPGKRKRR